MKKIDFFVAGVQKGGTTAFDSYLRLQPGIQMAKIKEIHHFDDEQSEDWSTPSHERLIGQYDWSVENVMRGESTPIYTYWPQSLERLQRYNPDAKLIILFRHPAFRAFSHWKMETARNADNLSFEAAISNAGRDRVRAAPGGVHRVFSYVERGFYSSQAERALSLFPRSQILFMRTDHMWQDFEQTIEKALGFLGVKERLPAQAPRKYVVFLDTNSLGLLPRNEYMTLLELFRDDIARTAEVTGLDLSDWLRPDYVEPMEPS